MSHREAPHRRRMLATVGGTMWSMFDIAKLTPVFDPVEDRLRLNIQTRQGPVLALWLTQRLGTLIVRSLSKQLDEEVKAEALGRPRAPVHEFEQSSAVARHKPEPAVAAAEAVDSGLVRSVDVGRSGQRFTLTWVSASGSKARMSTDSTQLRQLLEIFRRVFEKAEWDTRSWPEWLRRPASAPAGQAVSRASSLH